MGGALACACACARVCMCVCRSWGKVGTTGATRLVGRRAGRLEGRQGSEASRRRGLHGGVDGRRDCRDGEHGEGGADCVDGWQGDCWNYCCVALPLLCCLLRHCCCCRYYCAAAPLPATTTVAAAAAAARLPLLHAARSTPAAPFLLPCSLCSHHTSCLSMQSVCSHCLPCIPCHARAIYSLHCLLRDIV